MGCNFQIIMMGSVLALILFESLSVHFLPPWEFFQPICFKIKFLEKQIRATISVSNSLDPDQA